jgi:hypothetical protein
VSARRRKHRLTRDKRRPPARPVTDWRSVETAASRWDDLRITEEDLDLVAAFLCTQRAPRLHSELVAVQETLRDALRGFDWGAVDAATLCGLTAITAHLRETRDNGFPPETADRPVERWLTILYRLVLAAEGAGLESLTLARRAMTATQSYHNGAGEEIIRRTRDRLGFDAVSAVLNLEITGDPADPIALAALRHVRQTTGKHLRRTSVPGAGEFHALPRAERDETLTSAAYEEITRRLRGRTTLSDMVSAALEALPPRDARATRWDYVARDAAQRVRREHARDLPPQPGTETDRVDERADRPDEVATLRRKVAKIKADPKLRAALESETVRQPRAAAARKAGVSTRMLQHYLADLRRTLGAD